jgi:hypothetical protein
MAAAVTTEVVFRQRFCGGRDCRTVFFICRHCDRGQRYCSAHCRDQARIEQRRAANRRYQQSAEGRLDHRDRQRQYRVRHRQPPPPGPESESVTDQGSQTIPSSSNIQMWEAGSGESIVLCCRICGRTGRFIDPFPRNSWRKRFRGLSP